MTRYVVRRLASGVLLLLALTFVTYVVYDLIPYNPTQINGSAKQLGTDRSVFVQYARFLWRLIRHADLGHTYFIGAPGIGASVNHVIASDGAVTLSLVLGGAVALLLLAVPLGLLSALRPHTHLDRAILTFSLFGIAFHPFVVGLILKNVFGTRLDLLPTHDYCPLQAPAPVANPANCNPTNGLGCLQGHCFGHGSPWLWFSHLILPWLTFALFFLPFYVRIIRTRLIDLLGEPYVLTARMKGASETRILRHHLLRAVFSTTLAMLALDLGTSITAAIYVETIFGLPGLGHDALTALGGFDQFANPLGLQDLPFIVGLVTVIGTAILVLNILADLATAWLDPRLREGQA